MDQNRVCGRAIADAMLTYVTHGKDYDYEFGPKDASAGEEKDFFWRVDREDLKTWEVKKEDLMDIVDQIKAMGPVESVRDALGIRPRQGAMATDTFFVSRTNPKINCQAVFNSRSAWGDPLFSDYGQDVELHFYYDIHGEMDPAGRDDKAMNDMAVLMFGGMRSPGIMNL